MNLKQVVRRVFVVLLCMLSISSMLFPRSSVYANDSVADEETVESLPVTEAETEEYVSSASAEDMTVEEGEITDIQYWMQGIAFDAENEDVVFETSSLAFDTNTPGAYEVSYRVSSRNNPENFQVLTRTITVQAGREMTEAPEADKEEIPAEDAEDPLPVQDAVEETIALYAAHGIKISEPITYNYHDHGMNAYGKKYYTSLFKLEIPGVKEPYYAYCSQPSKKGPGSSTSGTLEDVASNDVLAKILYYGATPESPMESPAGDKGFFAQTKWNHFTGPQRFIITHLALGLADNDKNWAHNSNQTAQDAARALVAYAKDTGRPSMPVTKPSLSYTGQEMHNTETGKVISQTITFNAHSHANYEFTKHEKVEVVHVSGPKPVVNGNKVTVPGGSSFQLHAPENAHHIKIEESMVLDGEHVTYGAKKFRPSNTSQYQSLMMLFPTSAKEPHFLELNVNWLHMPEVSILKVDENNQPLAGASLLLKDAYGKEIESWVSTTEAKVFTSPQLTPGQTYTLEETSAPDGYQLTQVVKTFKMPLTSSAKPETLTVTLENSAYQVSISKQDITSSEELPGARLSILDESGHVVVLNGEELSWISSTTPRIIKGLPKGKYILREELAPSGYIVANDVAFEVTDTLEVQPVVMKDELTKRFVSKVSALTGKALSGAKLAIYNADGTELAKDVKGNTYTFESGEEPVEITGLPFGEYILRELEAPAGYATADDVKFTVSEETQSQTVVMTDEPIVVSISKVDITDGEELPGATLSILDKDGKVVELDGEKLTWVSTNEPHVIKMLPAGDYILREEMAPEGFVVANDIQFTVKDTGEVQKVVMTDEPTERFISKLSSVTGQALAGAKLAIYNAEGTELAKDVKGNTYTFTSGDAPVRITGLPFGEYILRELEAPVGYAKAEDVRFTVSAETQSQTVEMTDAPIVVSISKVDITNGEELPGATLSILDQDGNVVELDGEKLTWVSTNEPHVIKMLPAGDYILREEIAPAGYVVANEIKFTVTDTGDVQKVVMKDELTERFISKVSSLTGKALAGAELAIYNADGTELAKDVKGNTYTFTSEEEAVQITGLPFGEYILRELKAPAGYATAADVKFTVSEETQSQTVVMTDEPIVVSISKVDITNGEELPGATLSILDKDGKVVELDGEKLTWVSTNEPHVIQMLPAGEYVLREEIAPAGYVVANEIEFTVKDTGEVQKVVMKDELTERFISKLSSVTGKPLAGAKLAIYNADGKSLAKDVKGNTYTFDSEEEAVRITGLPFGEYILRELEAPAGYAKAEDVKFTVSEETQSQTVEMTDGPIVVTISKVDITDGEELPGATLSILDKEGNVVELDGEKLTWVSTNEPHVIKMLPAGDYILREEIAPAGYVKATDVPFTVTDSAEIQKVTMVDDVTRASFMKLSSKTNQPLAGAILTITDAEGNIVKDRNGEELRFASEEQAVEITHLPHGKYFLHEEKAPEGYAKAEDVEFELNEDSFNVTVTMVDDPITVHFSKLDITSGEELPGATLSILDKDGNVVVVDGEELTWVSGEEPKVIELLPAGDYILREIQAPDGYLVAEDVAFTITDTREIQSVVMEDDHTKVEIYKVDPEGKQLEGAVLKLTDENGKTVKEFTTTGDALRLDRLPVGKYVLSEVKAPAGYKLAEPVSFEVKAIADVQTVVMVDEPEDPKTPEPGKPNKKPSASTAAESGWMIWAVVAAVAVVVAVVVLVLKKKKSDASK